MKMGLDGHHGCSLFDRRAVDGGVETIVSVYAPVEQLVVSGLDPSNLVHGVGSKKDTTYSVVMTCFDK